MNISTRKTRRPRLYKLQFFDLLTTDENEAEVTGVSFLYRLQMIEVLIKGVVTGPRGISCKVGHHKEAAKRKITRWLSVITKRSEQLLQLSCGPIRPLQVRGVETGPLSNSETSERKAQGAQSTDG